ncbi:MAG TPA: outer membrane beta-barrel protein [Rhizomicrobium sp.]|jgi:opacity protein-like surface antigen
MRLRTAAFATVALAALAGPATAGTGLYLGLGVGWDGQNDMRVDQFSPPPATGTVTSNDGVIVAGTVGFKLPTFPIRLEFESGYDWHKINQFTSGDTTFGAGGHANIASELINAVYDFPVAPGFNIYGGAGLGAGHVWFAPYIASTGDQIAHVDHWGFMWQGIGGASFEVEPDADIFVDYRYRDASARMTTFTPVFGPVGSHSITENVIMAGVRFYMFPPEGEMAPEGGPPPPNPYYNQPPPPPPPPEYNAPMNNGATSGGATSGGAGGPQ